MDPTIEEALRAKENAEKLFTVKDFTGAKQFALRAQSLCPQLEGIAQMVATFEIYAATETKINREIDFYSIFGLDPSADKSVLKKRYKKMAVLLHPDKNKTVGADEAFKLVSEAWAVLSDNVKRHAYDLKRNKHLLASLHSSVNNTTTLDTFWTVCTSCRVQYEYLRKYVNKRLSCKNCRGVFVAVETGTAPVTYTPWSYSSENGYATTYVPSTSVCFGNGYEYNGNVSFQWNGNGYSDPNPNPNTNGLPSKSIGKSKGNEKQQTRGNETKLGRPPKKRKIETGDGPRNGIGETGIRDSECGDIPTRQYSFAPAFDARKMLIEKARTVIRDKLKEMKLESGLKTEKNGKTLKKSNSIPVPVPIPITVPDPDFHDFDMDRSEEVFKPKQIWAIYDEEDGMPRLYCIIRQVISVKPFQVHITYLNSKPEPESANSGISKSCGSFRVSHSDIVDQVNIFSHLLGREKTGRGGCITVYPKRGDVWAVYRNWSRKTAKARRQYEMVEVVDDYSDKVGVCVTPLVKLQGYKTVYQRGPTKNLISKKEMMKFSHQVPACLLKGQALNLPDGCWDLDPAATPEQLLKAAMEVVEEEEGKRGGCFGNLV
ncbi:uncharacterized protein LOC111889743 [Lactuca sativa]|nr:uncharacterized protein LOC111889743 [Lactuca sativa]XP_042753968.1 uncharacterized protein LOC111889743 [Lactuca sativa]